MRQKIIVASFDALIFEDLNYLKTKPVFGEFLEKAAIVERVRSIYPTLTYPCHATMATGAWPAKHGVLTNTFFEPGVAEEPWRWFHDSYKIPDILDRAKEAGLTTAVVGWPTMGCHPHVDWLVAEIAHTKAKTADEFYRDYTLTGTSKELWDEVCAEAIRLRTEEKKVELFNAKVASEIFRLHRPDIMLLHMANPDNARHKGGVFSELVSRALDDCEQNLKWLIEGIRQSGVAECTNLVVTADHGQMDLTRTVKPNVLFIEKGLAEVNPDGSLKSWRAWAHSTGMSTVIHVKDPADEKKVYDCLKEREGEGFSRIYTRAEAASYGYDGDFSFMLETDNCSKFSNAWTGNYMDVSDHVTGSHGFHPDKGPRPPIIAVGPAFREGARLEGANLIDGAPTWAKVLGIPLPDADGRALTEILR